ncbi:hypothetical protein XELAEV_18013952mg [Xenopus laevis]|uniref:G-protein coupled receptors family 1 profile domain-containing protein n=1 Tax=Xenopus laevis TaxID=8355 RepID=A0A974DQU6_XENLA|nr:hypothetical protein XELAEV_18013952mg [Xenopus laevis]
MLLLFWFKPPEIIVEECLVQIHSFCIMRSSVLLTMAFNHYLAICHPLRYSSILTNSMIAKMGVFVTMRGTLLIFPLPFLVRRPPFCGNHVNEQTYCDHMAVAKLSSHQIISESTIPLLLCAPSVQILISSLYLIIPPMFNPIIYGINTIEICKNMS